MAQIPAMVTAALIAATATVGTAAMTSGRGRTIQAAPRPSRIEARERADQRDVLARRRGTDANRRVGFGAGEAFTGAKKSLLGR